MLTPNNAGSEIPNKTDVNADMQISFVLLLLRWRNMYPNTAPPCATKATDISGFKKSWFVLARSCASIAPKVWCSPVITITCCTPAKSIYPKTPVCSAIQSSPLVNPFPSSRPNGPITVNNRIDEIKIVSIGASTNFIKSGNTLLKNLSREATM